jgi:hypothetical protein
VGLKESRRRARGEVVEDRMRYLRLILFYACLYIVLDGCHLFN